MYSRIINCTIKSDQVNDFRSALNSQFLPRIQAQPGFVENIESLDPSSGKFCCVTLWQSQADLDNYQNGLFQEISTAIGPLMEGAPSIETLPVENSSVHHVQAGRAAA